MADGRSDTAMTSSPSPVDDAQMLRHFLCDRDAPCPACGYNLRNLLSDICPECGERLMLHVRMVEPRQAAMLCGLIGLSAAAGLNGLLLIYGLIRFLPRASNDPLFFQFTIINATGLLAMASLILLWLKLWRWLRARAWQQR